MFLTQYSIFGFAFFFCFINKLFIFENMLEAAKKAIFKGFKRAFTMKSKNFLIQNIMFLYRIQE